MHYMGKDRGILLYVLTLICTIILMSACSGKQGGDGNGDVPIDSAILAEQILKVNADTVKKGDEFRKFATTQAAMDYMQKTSLWDKYKDGILPRMAEENLPYCEKLLNNTHDYFIVVDKGSMRLLVYDKYGRKITQFGIACARNYGQKKVKGDCRTPEGCFEAEGVYDSTDWLYVSDSGYVSPARGVYGTRFTRVKNPITAHVGIHGTSSPGSIGYRCSHGCIRLRNEDNMKYVKYVEAGTPIIINPGPRDIAVNKQEGNKVTWITVDDEPISFQQIESAEKLAKKEAQKKDSAKEPAVKDVEDQILENAPADAKPEEGATPAASETPTPKEPAAPAPAPSEGSAE